MLRSNYFYTTMTDIFNSCFNSPRPSTEKEYINFFEYIVRYDRSASSQNYLDKDLNSLKKSLHRSAEEIDTPYIDCIQDFLSQNLLQETTVSLRDNRYHKKDLNDLISHCHVHLGLSQNFLSDLTSGLSNNAAQDSLIDIIVLCYLVARHAFKSYPHTFKTEFPSLFDKDTSPLRTTLDKNPLRFTVVYGSPYEREIQYMSGQVLSQLSNISHCISYNQYLSSTLPIDTDSWFGAKYTNKVSQLYPGIWNAYLTHDSSHYLIIYNIPSPESLENLISNCRLVKNVILLCSYNVIPSQPNSDVRYIPFHEVYVNPSVSDVYSCLNKYEVEDSDHELGNMIFSISKGQPHTLYCFEKYIKKLKTSSSDFDQFKSENAYRLTAPDEDILTASTTYNINELQMKDSKAKQTNTSSGNSNKPFNLEITENPYHSIHYSFLGHIRRGYSRVLSVSEYFIVLLLALYSEDGITEAFAYTLLSKDQIKALTSLVDMGMASHKNGIYRYEDSILFPIAILHDDHLNEDEKTPLFNEVFFFLKSLQKELLHQRPVSLDYEILRASIKKTFSILFRLLHKSKSDYAKNYKNIWFYHIASIRFLLANRDVDTIREINESFKNISKQYTQRYKQHSDWICLYKYYKHFLHFIVSATYRDIYVKDIEKEINRLMNIIETANTDEHKAALADIAYWQILGSLMELLISYGTRLNLINIFNAYYERNITTVISSLEKLRISHHAIEKWQLLFKNMNNDPLFWNELKAHLDQDMFISDFCTQNESARLSQLHMHFDINYESPRFEQLACFEKNCIILLGKILWNQKNSSFSKSNIDTLYNIITCQYATLGFISTDMLMVFYSARIIFALTHNKEAAQSELTDIRKDFQRYKHIWNYNITLPIFDSLINQIEHFPISPTPE